MIYSKVVTFIISFLIWSLLTFSLDLQHILVGLLVSLFVAISMGGLFAEKGVRWFQIKRYFWFFVYLIAFIWECFKANIDVALRVLNPKCPINPGIVKVKTKLKTETALTILANSITLTPGTITVDLDQKEGVLYIHWIDVKSKNLEKATELIIKKFEKILSKVFE
ncbi:MAG: Na+/H+ antiporter subunit E [Candidatus Omnitrophica bacterium]|nr:Na+/H+ antiporter subunit E [Candidatus Omnitrophota bacterium]MCM8830881.1 Na+/H+ antiporter subunit E [Candidatus Omnitrophota bacterium]